MPIIPLRPIRRRSEEDFHGLDYRVMGFAFAVQIELGRLFEETVYKNELNYRLLKNGIEAVREFPVLLSYESFEKTFFIDLFVDGGIVYEAKVASALTASHRSQTLNYLFLTDTQHGKLINFRPGEVEHEFVSTKLDYESRRQVRISDDSWINVDRESSRLKQLVTELIQDWGAFLSLDAYRDAVVHFFGGVDEVCRDAELTYEGRLLGKQSVNCLTPETIFAFSAIGEGYASMRHQLQRMLNLMRPKHLQWVNLHQQHLRFATLARSP